jgi:peptide/nickel transport system substrate-binding protein
VNASDPDDEIRNVVLSLYNSSTSKLVLTKTYNTSNQSVNLRVVLDLSMLPIGTYLAQVKAIDAEGLGSDIKEKTISLPVRLPNIKPFIDVLKVWCETGKDIWHILANATDSDGKVEFIYIRISLNGITQSQDSAFIDAQRGSFETAYTYPVGNKYNASAWAWDDDGEMSEIRWVEFDTSTQNQPPIAKISASKTSAAPGEKITFDGSKSSDDKGIISYEWNFGDGTTLSGAIVYHSYSQIGTYVAKLTVLDAESAKGTDSVTISISKSSNTVIFDVYPPNAFVNDPVTFDASRSGSLSLITEFKWDFGDGQVAKTIASKVAHSYANTGYYTATLTATYQGGNTGSYARSVGIYRSDPSIKNASTFVSSNIGDPERLDPAIDYEPGGFEVIQNVYETLITYDGERADSFVPLLAEQMPLVSMDGKEYTFNLRKGVQFASGREMRSDDAIFSLTRVLIIGETSSPSWAMEQVMTNYVAQYIDQSIQNWTDDVNGWNGGVKPPQYLIDALGGKDPSLPLTNDDVTKVAYSAFIKIDDYTFKMRTTKPYPAFMSILVSPVASIMDTQVVKDKCGVVQVHAYCDYMDSNAVAGSGPYLVNEGKWEKGLRITMDLNPFWWREKQQGYKRYITQVVLRFDTEYSTRLQLLKSGDTDFADIGWQSKADVEGNPDLRIVSGQPTFTMNFLGLNENIRNLTGANIPADFFKNPDARKAFAYMWPYDDFIKNVMNSGGFAPQGPIPKGMFGYREDFTKRYVYDPAKAEEYFKKIDNGKWWDQGIQLPLYYNTGNDPREKACNLFKTALESLNPKFKVLVQGLDWPTYLQKVKNKELTMYYLGWYADYADPDDYVVPILHSVRGYYPSRISYADPQMDKLIDEAGMEVNETKRLQLYAQIQDLEFEDAPYIWQIHTTNFHVERIWVCGYYHNPMIPGGTFWAYLKGQP